MGEMENTVEFYYEKLKGTTNPGTVLAVWFGSLYSVDASKSIIIMCNRLIKVFGRFTVFFAILDMAGSYPELSENMYPLLYTICKRKFETAHSDSTIQSHESLDKYVAEMEKKAVAIGKSKKKLPDSEGL